MKKQIIILLVVLLINFSLVQAMKMKSSPKIFNLIFLTSDLATFFHLEQKPIADLVAWLNQHPDEVNVMTPDKVKIARARITPLIHAVICSNYEAITLLLNHPDIKINMKDSRGKTALHHVTPNITMLSINGLSAEINETYLKIFAELIAKGASIKIQDELGHTPLNSIPPQLYDQVQRCIKEQNDKLLLEGARRADWRAIQLAMRDGADINAQDIQPGLRGNTAAHYAIRAVSKTMEELAQSQRENVAVHPQALEQVLNFVRLILSYQPDLNIENEDSQGQPGLTVMQLASTWPKVLEIFFENSQTRMEHLHQDARYRQ